MKRLAVCLTLLLIFLTVCVLVYFQTLSAQLQLEQAEDPLDELDNLFEGEK